MLEKKKNGTLVNLNGGRGGVLATGAVRLSFDIEM
jgi:hypothetical protein